MVNQLTFPFVSPEPPLPRPRNTEVRRAQIVDALRRLMSERGYDGATVAAIAREAGLTPGLVHYHFGTKEEVLLGLVEQIEGIVTERLKRRLALAQTGWDRVDAWIDAHVGRGADSNFQAVACWVAIGAEAVRKPAVRVAYTDAVRRDLKRLELYFTEVGAEDPHHCAVGLLSGVEGAYRLAAGAPQAVPLGYATTALKRMARGLAS